MSSTFTPDDRPYLLYTPFYAPTEKGDVWAVALSNRTATLVTSAISICIAVITLFLWDIIRYVALSFKSSVLCRRFVAQAVIWNSTEPWGAFKELVTHSYQCVPPAPARRSLSGWRDAIYSLSFAVVAIVIYGGSAATGTFLPTQIQFDTVAPARPSAVYYPDLLTDPASFLLAYSFLYPSALRAYTKAITASIETQSLVKTTFQKIGTTEGGDQVLRLTYNYSLTGTDLGIQFGSDLTLEVHGSCVTEYRWSIEDPKMSEFDAYQLWGDPSQVFLIPLDNASIQHPPRASIRFHPGSINQYELDGNISFAFLAWTAHRASISKASDPWYATELGQQGYTVPYGAKFWIKRRRPALSCWEQNAWTYRGQRYPSVGSLREAPAMRVPPVLLDVLEAALVPSKLGLLGNQLQDTILQTYDKSPNGVIDAAKSSLESSVKLLILASYIATRDALVDTTQFGRIQRLPNLFQGSDGNPRNGADGFVVSKPGVQTFSIASMIILTTVMVTMLLLRFVAYPRYVPA